jgi:hypothetical protein
MYVEGRIVKVEKCTAEKRIYDEKTFSYKTEKVPAKKVYIKQLMTGYVYWGYSWDCLVSKRYPDIVRIDGNEKFHMVRYMVR